MDSFDNNNNDSQEDIEKKSKNIAEDTKDETEDLFKDINDIDLEKFNGALEKLSSEDFEKENAQLKNVVDYGNDIDKELENMIKKEELEEDPETMDDSFINKPSIYSEDGLEEIEEQVSNDKRETSDFNLKSSGKEENVFSKLLDKLNSFPIKIFISILVILIITIIASSVVLVSNVAKMNEKVEALDSQRETEVDTIAPPKQSFNNSNFVFIKQSKVLNNNNLTLTKMVTDSLSTAFYFDTYIDPREYIITLSDDKNNVYALDSYFERNSDIDKRNGNRIKFSPLREGTEGFELNVEDAKTGDAVSYNIDFEQPITHPPAKYLNQPMDIIEESHGVGAKIYGAEFSASGSRIYFGFDTNKNGETISMVENDNKDLIEMNHMSSKVMPEKNTPNIYEFKNDNRVIGRMDFSAIKNLSGNVEIIFNNIFREIEVNQELEISQLFLNDEKNMKTIAIGGYDVFLERMGIQGDKCLLILHSENILNDTNKGKTPENSERTETQLETELIIKVEDENEVIIPGKCMSIKEGSDIIYDLSAIKQSIVNIPYSSYKINIKKAKFKIEDAKVDINLDNIDKALSSSKVEALDSIKQSFEQRLDYKSKKIGKNEIIGFTEELLNDNSLMQNYTPIEKELETQSSIQILTYNINGANISAVVSELWISKDEGREIGFSSVHKVSAYKTESGWIILEDILAK